MIVRSARALVAMHVALGTLVFQSVLSLAVLPARADSGHWCLSAEEFLNALQHYKQPLSSEESMSLEFHFGNAKIARSEIHKFVIPGLFTAYRDVKPYSGTIAWRSAHEVEEMLFLPSKLSHPIHLDFKAVGFDRGDVISNCRNARDQFCIGQSLYFSSLGRTMTFVFHVANGGIVDDISISNSVGEQCGVKDWHRFGEADHARLPLQKMLGRPETK